MLIPISPANQINRQNKSGFWSSIDNPPFVYRMRDRVFFGDAAVMATGRVGTNSTFLSSASVGANWAPRDSQVISMSDRGAIALAGVSRASDGNDVASLAPIGVAGFLLNDTSVETRAGWALYADVQHEPVATNSASFGLEVAAKNKGADIVGTPYGTGYGVFGVWLQGGGDASYGGSPTNPNNAGIVILKGASTWNTGILITSDAITGATGNAIKMATGHTIRWELSAGQIASRIRSDVSIAGRDVSLIFDNFTAYFQNNAGKRNFSVQDGGGAGSGVNYLEVSGSATGVAASLTAKGDDTDVDLALIPKGAGVVKFGTRTAIAAETVTGYITIKDSGGTTRKLAVVS